MKRLASWVLALVFVVPFVILMGVLMIVELIAGRRLRSERETARIIAASRGPSMVRRQAD